jgi:hypothetical protein
MASSAPPANPDAGPEPVRETVGDFRALLLLLVIPLVALPPAALNPQPLLPAAANASAAAARRRGLTQAPRSISRRQLWRTGALALSAR